MNSIVLDISPGMLAIEEHAGLIFAVTWCPRRPKQSVNSSFSPLLKSAVQQMKEYFQGKRRIFDLPIKPQGTKFQKSVWRAIAKIPFGETRCYDFIARELYTAPRAVGMAAGKNPLLILIPCHRVIRKSGALGGFSGGEGVFTKQQLLSLERQLVF
jgi:methylated-DNA-[protein]-cysteine S-methyltransferase